MTRFTHLGIILSVTEVDFSDFTLYTASLQMASLTLYTLNIYKQIQNYKFIAGSLK